MVNFLHNLTFPFINFNLNNSPSVFPPLLNSPTLPRSNALIWYILILTRNINQVSATKKQFKCLEASFQYLVEALGLLSCPTWAAYFLPSVVWSLAAPSTRVQLTTAYFFRSPSFLATPSISAHLSLSEPPHSQKMPYPGAHFSN